MRCSEIHRDFHLVLENILIVKNLPPLLEPFPFSQIQNETGGYIAAISFKQKLFEPLSLLSAHAASVSAVTEISWTRHAGGAAAASTHNLKCRKKYTHRRFWYFCACKGRAAPELNHT